jgi:DNA polymerase III delta prime subunit
MFNDESIKENVESHYQTIRRTELNQSDIAKARRNIRERKETYVALDDELNRQMRDAAMNGDMSTFQSVAAQAKKLNDLGRQIDSEENEFESVINNAPVKRQPRVAPEVKTEIHNLYHAGVSNQTQLAEDYQVSQATVNKIVNDDPNNYRRGK